jgi:hypothetical protein
MNKSERAIGHLCCYQFKRAMADVDYGERPHLRFNRKTTSSKSMPSSTALPKAPLSYSRSSIATKLPGIQKSMEWFTIHKLS